MRLRDIIIGLMLLFCEGSVAEVFMCKDPNTGQTTFTDKACGTSGERTHVPLHEANGMKPPERSSQTQHESTQSARRRTAVASAGYDPERDSYERKRRALQIEMESSDRIDRQIAAKQQLRALDEQYRTSKKLSGAEKDNYNRRSNSLNHDLDSSGSIPEWLDARRKIAEVNEQHGGKDPFPKSNSTGATTMPVTPAPPSAIIHCDSGPGGVCIDNQAVFTGKRDRMR